MLTGGCWVTQSLDHAMPWVLAPLSTSRRAGTLLGLPLTYSCSTSLALTFPSLHQAPC